MPDSMDKVYRHDPAIVARLIAGEMVLVPVRRSTGGMDHIYTLNETGARIWELIDGQRPAAEILAVILAEYDVQAAQAGQDLEELLAGLLEHGALVEVGP